MSCVSFHVRSATSVPSTSYPYPRTDHSLVASLRIRDGEHFLAVGFIPESFAWTPRNWLMPQLSFVHAAAYVDSPDAAIARLRAAPFNIDCPDLADLMQAAVETGADPL